jgi:hypothetical protein
MTNSLLFVLVALGTLNCNSFSSTTEESSFGLVQEEVSEQAILSEAETCFLYTEGTESQDSTFVSLKVNGDSVTGFMHWQPWQTDGAYGTITAVRSDNIIRGMHNYVIEGSEQSEEVIFKISNDKLYKASGELTEDSGEEIILRFKNPDEAVFKYEFREIDCSLFERF